MKTNFHKIDALHPYDDNWCIKAKLSRKYPSKTIKTKNGEAALFNVELIDDQVGCIVEMVAVCTVLLCVCSHEVNVT